MCFIILLYKYEIRLCIFTCISFLYFIYSITSPNYQLFFYNMILLPTKFYIILIYKFGSISYLMLFLGTTGYGSVVPFMTALLQPLNIGVSSILFPGILSIRTYLCWIHLIDYSPWGLLGAPGMISYLSYRHFYPVPLENASEL